MAGGGGRHIYFAHPGREVRNRVGLAPGIDLRGDGGCIIAPPSVHPSGERYRWKADHAPGQVDLAPLPVWLEQPRFSSDGLKGHSTTYWRKLVHEGVKEGQRNSSIASFAGHLLWHGVDPDVVLDLGPDGFLNGKDVQLDYVIKDLLERIAKDPPKIAPAPPVVPRPLAPEK